MPLALGLAAAQRAQQVSYPSGHAPTSATMRSDRAQITMSRHGHARMFGRLATQENDMERRLMLSSAITSAAARASALASSRSRRDRRIQGRHSRKSPTRRSKRSRISTGPPRNGEQIRARRAGRAPRTPSSEGSLTSDSDRVRSASHRARPSTRGRSRRAPRSLFAVRAKPSTRNPALLRNRARSTDRR